MSRVLARPPRLDIGQLPYHLDPAHASCFRELPKGSCVLELGCGGCQNRPWARQLGLEYVGTDIAVGGVAQWLQRMGKPDILCDAHFLPFRDEQFHLVYGAALLEHLACPPLAAKEALRVLRPGGYFLGSVSFLEPWHDDSLFHMTPAGVAELLTLAGFSIEYIWPGRGWHAFYAIPSMAFRGPFRALRYLGRLLGWAYQVQGALRDVYRRVRGNPPEDRILRDARIAGAIHWIAKRPLDPDSAPVIVRPPS